MTTFYWVRHGPTHQKKFVGWRDVPADLSDQEQIGRLADFLPQDAVVVSSDLKRSVDTATAIQGSRQRLRHMAELREFHFGSWDGLSFDAIASEYPDTSRAYWETPGDIAPPGGESWNMAAERVSHAADHLERQFAGRNIVVVAHIGVILTQAQRGLGCSAYDVLSHHIDNLSVTEIVCSGDKKTVARINHCP